MKIYTKTGDDGTTSLFGGKRVSKADGRIDAYGTIDELNSWIGILSDHSVNKGRYSELIEIQDKLFTIGSMLAVEPGNQKVRIPKLSESDVYFLEHQIDKMNERLPPLKAFVLPGGDVSVSHAHLARTVCRRAERKVASLGRNEKVDPIVLKYLNRLSDYLFVLARIMCRDLNIEERLWKPGIDS